MRRITFVGMVLGLIGWAIASQPRDRVQPDSADTGAARGGPAKEASGPSAAGVVDPVSHQLDPEQDAPSDEDRGDPTANALRATRSAVDARLRLLMENPGKAA